MDMNGAQLCIYDSLLCVVFSLPWHICSGFHASSLFDSATSNFLITSLTDETDAINRPKGFNDLLKMAPLVNRDYQCAGEPNRYSLRTTKRDEEDASKVHNVDVSKINGKEDFFRCMGLQMKRHQCHTGTLQSSRVIKKLNHISNSVKLRDCSVVILGVRCKICRKFFKCQTDLKEHTTLEHYGYIATNLIVSDSNCTETSDEICKMFSKPFEDDTVARKSFIKLHGKVLVIFKVGREKIGQRTLKRKYLKMNTIDIATQTESTDSRQSSVRKNVQESDVSSIDFPVLRNGPCRSYSPTEHTLCNSNQYLTGNIVANEQGIHEVSASQRDTTLSRPTESRITPDTVSPPLTVKVADSECDLQQNISTIENKVNKYSPIHHNDVIPNINITNDVRVPEPCLKGTFKPDESNTKNILKPTENVTKQSAQTAQQNIIIDCNEKRVFSYRTQKPEAVNRVQVIMPVIVPIILPNDDSSRTTTTEHRSPATPQQPTKTFTINEQESDDEVQEVLRIIRGHNNKDEINHESPNRLEQEMLVRDAIRGMIRMEQQGWHLLETEDVESMKRKKLNVRNSDTSDEFTKKKRLVQQASDNNNTQTKRVTEDKNFARIKESPVNVYKTNHSVLYLADNVKENLFTCNGNKNISSEILRRYGFNYYNEICEINNNTETMQEAANCFLAPCSGGSENRSNKPTVIDLVNDTDE